MPGAAAAAGAAISSIGAAASAGMAAVGGLSGLATGISVASGAIGLVGAVTGSKTLQKIGMYGGMVGGLGQGASMLSNAAKGANAAGTVSRAASSGFQSFPSSAGAGATAANIGSVAEMGKDALSMGNINSVTGMLPKTMGADNKNVIQRMNELLTRYDTTANVLAGLGQGYVMYKGNELKKEQIGIYRDRFNLEKQQYDTQQANRAAVPTLPSLGQGGIRRADGTPLLNMGAR